MKKLVLLLCFFILAALPSYAHLIAYELNRVKNTEVFWKYTIIGYQHIIPLGLDHILFILCVFFLNTSVRQIIIQASIFTLAHSVTLGLAMYGIIKPVPDIIEPIIAASILFLALENIWSDKVKPWRMVMVFLFGLVHGMGFAGALSELGMPSNAFATALVSFNVGVELGQLTIILCMYLFVAKLFSQKVWYRRRVVIPSSLAIALVATYWTIERLFFIS
jgi:hypothetical protein